MSIPTYLLTGVTGGLGSRILNDMLNKHKVPGTSITVTSRSEGKRSHFEAMGVHFKVLDYNQPATIKDALLGVDQFLFMSSSQFDNNKRKIEHQNVVDAAKANRVKRTWYVSLAFGGFAVNNVVSVQQVHNWTEEMLIESGLEFVSLRAGAYADAFPLFLNWYPTSQTIALPLLDPPISAGRLALTSRDELAEGIAALFSKGFHAYPSIQPKSDRHIVLLTAANTVTFVNIAEAINNSQTQSQPVVYLQPGEWVDAAAKNDQGEKSKTWFESRLVWFWEMCKGALATTDPALMTLLEREPLDGVTMVGRLVSRGGYEWHQNSASGARSAR